MRPPQRKEGRLTAIPAWRSAFYFVKIVLILLHLFPIPLHVIQLSLKEKGKKRNDIETAQLIANNSSAQASLQYLFFYLSIFSTP